MAKHKPGVIYGLRKTDSKLRNGYVRTYENKDLAIVVYKTNGLDITTIRVDRKTARLLAKRINQCLDDTK